MPRCGRPVSKRHLLALDPSEHALSQLCDGPRTVYLTLDTDSNGSGQQAAGALTKSPRTRHSHSPGLTARGHDPNSFFVSGAQGLMSFTACWRRLACEIPCNSTARSEQCPQSVSCGRYRPGSGGSIAIWIRSVSVAWPIPPCAACP